MGKLFGTDGVRGVYGTELTDDLARKLGYYGTKVLSETTDNPKIVIGRDTRISGPALEAALCEGISAAGGDVLLAGVIPTPAVAVLTRELNADAGIVISASHNPYEYNGIKFFNNQGFKLPDQTEDEIEAMIFEDHDTIEPVKNHVHLIEDAPTMYLEKVIGEDYPDLSGKKIVVDCANGASVNTAPDYFSHLGAELVFIGDDPDGKNINKACGSTHLDLLAERVLEEDADIGVAFDGDADRFLAVDEKGQIVDGDKIMALLSKELKDQGLLDQDTLVVTVMSNIGLHKVLKENGIHATITDVGDRYVLENMLENGYVLGGEQSGHIINLHKNTTGDGLLTAAMLMKLLEKEEKPLSELAGVMTVYPQILVNAKVDNAKKMDYLNNPTIREACDQVEAHFAGSGRVLIRPSGTEPLVRVMIEGEDQEELTKIATDLAKLIEDELN